MSLLKRSNMYWPINMLSLKSSNMYWSTNMLSRIGSNMHWLHQYATKFNMIYKTYWNSYRFSQPQVNLFYCFSRLHVMTMKMRNIIMWISINPFRTGFKVLYWKQLKSDRVLKGLTVRRHVLFSPSSLLPLAQICASRRSCRCEQCAVSFSLFPSNHWSIPNPSLVTHSPIPIPILILSHVYSHSHPNLMTCVVIHVPWICDSISIYSHVATHPPRVSLLQCYFFP